MKEIQQTKEKDGKLLRCLILYCYFQVSKTLIQNIVDVVLSLHNIMKI